jgi:hypothetical protein
MCGHARAGSFVRIVVLRYPARATRGPADGRRLTRARGVRGRRMVARLGALRGQPDRYGVLLPTREDPSACPTAGWW